MSLFQIRRQQLLAAPIALALCAAAGAAEIDREALQKAIAATVFVKTERAFQRERFPASGSGFFISPEGHVLTCWHVVADQVEGWLWGREREITAKVLRLWVVVNSGAPGEREIPARILARDRELDLALLKVQYRPPHWIDPENLAELHLADPVWIVGFPLGSIAAALKQPGTFEPDANPEVSIAAGMVTSLRRDMQGRLAALQTDAPVNPGNSGGPMLAADGRLAGVVFAKFNGGEGLGLAVPSGKIEEFIRRQLVNVTLEPGVVLEPPSPIRVTVTSNLVGVDGLTAEVELTGDDIPTTQVQLTREGDRLRGEVPFPERIHGAPLPAFYTATVSIRDASGRTRFARRYRLDCVKAAIQRLGSQRDPARMMADRQLLPNEMEISDYMAARRSGMERGKSLAEVAGRYRLRRNESGSVVIDNHAVREVASFTPDPSLYRNLPEGEPRDVARRFDVEEHRLKALESRIRELKNARPATDTVYGLIVYYFMPWSNERISADERRKLLQRHAAEVREVRTIVRGLRARARRLGICRCPDGTWYRVESSPCGTPPLPTP